MHGALLSIDNKAKNNSDMNYCLSAHPHHPEELRHVNQTCDFRSPRLLYKERTCKAIPALCGVNIFCTFPYKEIQINQTN